MSGDKEFKDSLLWAETIVQERQHNTKKKVDATSNLKIALYVLVAVAVILLLIYIIHRAYKIPDPPSILDEVKDMTNQINPSDVGGFSSDDS